MKDCCLARNPQKAEGSSRNEVYNNTIVMAADSRWVINIPKSKGNTPNPTGNKIKNNILYTPRLDRGSVLIYTSAPAGFESDYNVVVDRFSKDGGKRIISLSQWQALGYDQNSLIATPDALFVDPANDDYHLKDGSPAIDAGVFLAGVDDDLEGVSRPQGSTHDIGCYEKL